MPSPPLTTLDLVCLVMDSPERPLDFALLQDFDSVLSADGLRRGAHSARNLYAQTRCRVVDGYWSELEPAICESAFRTLPCVDCTGDIERFLKIPFLPEAESPLRQLWISDAQTGGGSLITRIHHCAADLISGLAWIRHQLRVAAGFDDECAERADVTVPALADPPPGARRNPGWARCEPLWTRSGEPSGERCWTTFSLDSGPLLGLSRANVGFTFNDVLTMAALETLHHWNRSHGEGTRKVGIWLPVNIRHDPLSGFGNASSRIRVRRDYPDRSEPMDKCRAVRSQVDLARERGEWVVPQRTVLSRLPARVGFPLVRRYLNRPWADVGTAAFSHVQRWPGQGDAVFDGLRQFGVLGAMHSRHALMFVAVTCPEQTWLTITYDAALLCPEDIELIKEQYLGTVAAVAREA